MTGFELYMTLLLTSITICQLICAMVICKIANHLTLKG